MLRHLAPFDFLRIVLALLMAAHGLARIYLGIVDDFGGFLSLQGFPLGAMLAWMVTVLELAGAVLLISNKLVPYICYYFIGQLLVGIALVHAQEGWFVVGAGRNGMEYSVLLICCFLVLAWQKRYTAASHA